MPSQSLLGLALVVSSAVAAPYQFVDKREITCASELEGQAFVAAVQYYTGSDCNDDTFVSGSCVYSNAADSEGSYSCNPTSFPENAPFYAKVVDSPFDQMQLVYTRDQSCPPNGPGAVFATLVDNQSCVLMNLAGSVPGVSVFPHGGSGISRVAESENPSGNDINAFFVATEQPKKRDELIKREGKCSGFEIESSTPSTTNSVQISDIVDCINGAEAGCAIETSEEYSKSISTSYSVTAGGGIEGIFEVSATFGQEYTDTVTTSTSYTNTIPQGQAGYLSAYSPATLFKGWFTGCDSGDERQEGQALVIKNTITYGIVLTGA